MISTPATQQAPLHLTPQQLVAKVLEAVGESPTLLARLLSTSRPQVARLERSAHTARFDTLERLVTVLGERTGQRLRLRLLIEVVEEGGPAPPSGSPGA